MEDLASEVFEEDDRIKIVWNKVESEKDYVGMTGKIIACKSYESMKYYVVYVYEEDEMIIFHADELARITENERSS